MILRKIARPLLGAAFIASGAEAVRAPAGPARTAEPLLNAVPASSQTVIQAAGAVQVAAGIALALGKAPRVSSTVLAGTLIPTTVFASDFWNEQDPLARSAKQSAFVKNLGLLGGVLIAAGDTEGKPSLAWRGRRQLVATRDAVIEALPSQSQRAEAQSSLHSTLESATDRASSWAHDVAERFPSDEVAETARKAATTARSTAEDLAHTVAERAPQVADEVVSTSRRWRRQLTA